MSVVSFESMTREQVQTTLENQRRAVQDFLIHLPSRHTMARRESKEALKVLDRVTPGKSVEELRSLAAAVERRLAVALFYTVNQPVRHRSSDLTVAQCVAMLEDQKVAAQFVKQRADEVSGQIRALVGRLAEGQEFFLSVAGVRAKDALSLIEKPTEDCPVDVLRERVTDVDATLADADHALRLAEVMLSAHERVTEFRAKGDHL